jgi:hypothetical protein
MKNMMIQELQDSEQFQLIQVIDVEAIHEMQNMMIHEVQYSHRSGQKEGNGAWTTQTRRNLSLKTRSMGSGSDRGRSQVRFRSQLPVCYSCHCLSPAPYHINTLRSLSELARCAHPALSRQRPSERLTISG